MAHALEEPSPLVWVSDNVDLAESGCPRCTIPTRRRQTRFRRRLEASTRAFAKIIDEVNAPQVRADAIGVDERGTMKRQIAKRGDGA
jgi:hypothetical protein